MYRSCIYLYDRHSPVANPKCCYFLTEGSPPTHM